MNFRICLVSFLCFYSLVTHLRKLKREPVLVPAVGCLREPLREQVRGGILSLLVPSTTHTPSFVTVAHIEL